MPIRKATKIPLNEHREGCLTCAHCGLSVTINASACENLRGALVLRCPCGFIFYASLSKRRFRRKSTALRGVYIKEANRKKTGEILVQNLSLTGLRFKTVFQHDIAAHDTLRVKFALDDEHRNIISERVEVTYVRGYQVGVRFVTADSDKIPLHSYLSTDDAVAYQHPPQRTSWQIGKMQSNLFDQQPHTLTVLR
jgi:PilZ domain